MKINFFQIVYFDLNNFKRDTDTQTILEKKEDIHKNINQTPEKIQVNKNISISDEIFNKKQQKQQHQQYHNQQQQQQQQSISHINSNNKSKSLSGYNENIPYSINIRPNYQTEKNQMTDSSNEDNFDNQINNLYKFTKIKTPIQVKIDKPVNKQIFSQKENLFKNFQEIDDIFKNKKECLPNNENINESIKKLNEL